MDKDLELIESGKGLSESSTTTKETSSGTRVAENDNSKTGTRISQYTYNDEKKNESDK